jgi:hypothetical protein
MNAGKGCLSHVEVTRKYGQALVFLVVRAALTQSLNGNCSVCL